VNVTLSLRCKVAAQWCYTSSSLPSLHKIRSISMKMVESAAAKHERSKTAWANIVGTRNQPARKWQGDE